MNDQPPSDQPPSDQPFSGGAELASAALDGELTAAERARVAASPELTADLITFTDLRAELAAVPVAADVRERAIVAALDVFDELAAVRNPDIAAAAALPDAPRAPVVSLLARRQRQYRWLTGVAAAGLVVVVAAGVINRGSDDKKSTGANADAVAESQTRLGITPTADSSPQYAVPASGADVGGIYGPVEVTMWALAPNFDTIEDLVASAKDSSFGLGVEPVPVAPPETAPDGTGPPAATSVEGVGSDQRSAVLATCPETKVLERPDVRAAPIVLRGQQLLAVVDQAAGTLLLIDPTTCAVVENINID